MDYETQRLGLEFDRQKLLDSIKSIKHEGMLYFLDREIFPLKLPQHVSIHYGPEDFRLLMQNLDNKNRTFMTGLNAKYPETVLVPIKIFEDFQMNENGLIALVKKDPKKEDLIGRVQLLSTAFIHENPMLSISQTKSTVEPYLLVKKDKSFASCGELRKLIKKLGL